MRAKFWLPIFLIFLAAVIWGYYHWADKKEQALEQGKVAFRRGDFDLAIRYFDEAIRLDPKYAKAYNNRGYTYTLKGEFDKAIADLTEAIQLNPNLAQAYCNRGLAYRAKGDTTKAEADFARAKELGYKP